MNSSLPASIAWPRRLPGVRTPRAQVPRISPALLRLFAFYLRGYLGRHFAAVHLSGPPPNFHPATGPAIVYLNHPSWWDPLVCLLLARRFAADCPNFAPIDSRMLARFRFFRKLGFFGVAKDSPRGVVDFLETSAAILRNRNSILWVTPQGEFVDARVRPASLKAGIGQLPALNAGLRFFPLALDYFFSSERLPSVAARFGDPIASADFPGFNRHDWTSTLAAALEQTQDTLAREVTSNRIAQGEPLLAGRSGMGGLYGLWQSIRGTR